MERDDERIRKQVERCVGELRSDIDALEKSNAIDVGVVHDLTQIIDDIQGHIGAITEPWIRAVTD